LEQSSIFGDWYDVRRDAVEVLGQLAEILFEESGNPNVTAPE